MKLDGIEAKLDALGENLGEVKSKLERMETFLFIGNGKPSFKARIETLEALQDSKHESEKETRNWKITAGIAIAAAILSPVLDKVLT